MSKDIHVIVHQRKTSDATAQETYKFRLDVSRSLLRSINSRLDAHARKGAESGNWGYAGDLGTVNERLKDILSMLG